MLLPTFLIQSIIVLSISLNLNVHSNVNIDICNAFKQVTVVDDNELSDGSSWHIKYIKWKKYGNSNKENNKYY